VTRGFRDEDEPRESVRLANVKALRGSDKALLCLIDGEQIWIPQSQITDDSEVFEAGGTGDLVITKWLAEQKELI
jgi:hypothetical protein